MKVTPYLKLALELETEDSNSIAYLKTYKINITNPEYNWNSKPTNSFSGINESLEINFKDINENTQTWGTVVPPKN